MKKMPAICAGVLVSLSLLVSLPAFGGGGIFRAVDDKMVFRIISSTEAEISMDGENYVCSYSEQGGEIRAVLEIHGTKKALYFARVEVGLKDRNGVTLYDPAHYDTVMRKVSAERRQKDLNKRLLKAADENNFSDAVAAVKAGADINTSNSNGAKAIHFAAACGNPDLVRFLLEHGATPNIRTVSGDTPLYFAATGTRRGLRANRKTAGYDKTLKILIENGANLDVQNRNSVTPLMKAMFKKYREGIRILVEAGANRTIKTNNGKTVWDFGPHDWLRTREEAERYKKARTETKRIGTCKDVKHTTGKVTRSGVIVTNVSVKPTTFNQFGGKGAPVYFMDLNGPPTKEPYPNATWGWNGFEIKLSSRLGIAFRSESARDKCYDIILKAYQDCIEKFKEGTEQKIKQHTNRYEAVLHMAHLIKDARSKALALAGIATELEKAGNKKNSEVVFSEAIEIAKSIKGEDVADSVDKTLVLAGIATELGKAGNNKESEVIFSEAIEVADSIKDAKPKSWAFAGIATELAKTGKMKNSIEIAASIKEEVFKAFALAGIATELAKTGKMKNSIEIAASIKEEVFKAFALVGVATELAKAGNKKKAEAVFSEAIEVADSIKDASSNGPKAWAFASITTALAKAGKITKSLEMAEFIKDDKRKAVALAAIATELAKAGNKKKAEVVFSEAIKIADSIKYEGTKTRALVGIATELAKAGKVRKAIGMAFFRNYTDYYEWEDSGLQNVTIELARLKTKDKQEDAEIANSIMTALNR